MNLSQTFCYKFPVSVNFQNINIKKKIRAFKLQTDLTD
jgi:hypothetical protein